MLWCCEKWSWTYYAERFLWRVISDMKAKELCEAWLTSKRCVNAYVYFLEIIKYSTLITHRTGFDTIKIIRNLNCCSIIPAVDIILFFNSYWKLECWPVKMLYDENIYISYGHPCSYRVMWQTYTLLNDLSPNELLSVIWRAYLFHESCVTWILNSF
jgi:hypothetical protein